MRPLFLIQALGLAILAVALGGCSLQDKDLTRRKAEAAIEQSIVKAVEGAGDGRTITIKPIIGSTAPVSSQGTVVYEALEELGYITLEKRRRPALAPYTPMDVSFTEKGRHASEEWEELGEVEEATSQQNRQWRVPVAAVGSLEVTGLKEVSETVKDADWELELLPLNEIGERLLELGYLKRLKGTSRFELYDDGWRIKE